MKENELRYAVVTALAAIVCSTISCQMTNAKIAGAVEAGADPIEAMCAFSAITSTDCDFVAGSRK